MYRARVDDPLATGADLRVRVYVVAGLYLRHARYDLDLSLRIGIVESDAELGCLLQVDVTD